jgi:hypothetical protein
MFGLLLFWSYKSLHTESVLFLVVIQQRTDPFFSSTQPQVKSSVKMCGHLTYGEPIVSRRLSFLHILHIFVCPIDDWQTEPSNP